MASSEILSKKVAINKTNVQTVAVVAVASFITVFSLVAAQAVWSQTNYQARVTSAKEKAHNQLLQNTRLYQDLINHYQAFVSMPTNVIGGSINGSGSNDGNNAQIILDALPPNYDFPALATSLDKVLTSHGFNVSSITGTDDQLNQQSNVTSNNPQPVSIPFSFTVSNTNYSSISQLVGVLQQSIRPIQIDSMDVTGGGNSMTLNIQAHSYYQPSKSLTITEQVVK